MGTAHRGEQLVYDLLWVLISLVLMISTQPSNWSYFFAVCAGVLLHDAIKSFQEAKPEVDS